MTETPTPTADVSAEQRESDDMTAGQWRVEHCYKNNTIRICQGDQVIYAGITDSSAWEIVAAHNRTIARRATAPAPQRQDGYRAGMGGRNAEQND